MLNYAAPLDQVEALVRKAHARKEEHLPNTLTQATGQAIRDGDVSLRDDNKVVIYEGMAEKLMWLCEDLYPIKAYPDIFPTLEQARLAAPLEDKKQIEDKERNYQVKIKEIFDAENKKNDSNTLSAIQTFKDWTKEISVIMTEFF